MKGKTTFTIEEAQKIKKLIEEKISSTSDEQKIIREKIRNIGFYYSDFSSKKEGYTVADFESLISSGKITID